ncbi:MAG: hypothetical protein BGN92_02920 [Sphingobacteriales bacterium 41-5]|nr:MAG: hypothetical protein BGN92_02920 [Sphingobacteriales bacterium 41-5]
MKLIFASTPNKNFFMSCDTLERLRNGDHKAFAEIYGASHKRVYFYFLKLAGDEFVAKELTQKTFIKLWRYRTQVALELSIDQQIFQKARQIYIDWLRQQARNRRCVALEEIHEVPAVIEVTAMSELRQALNHLSPKRKKVFELRHIYGYSYKEIAELLNISVRTVDNHLLKATAQLRKVFNIYSGIGIILLTSAQA